MEPVLKRVYFPGDGVVKLSTLIKTVFCIEQQTVIIIQHFNKSNIFSLNHFYIVYHNYTANNNRKQIAWMDQQEEGW